MSAYGAALTHEQIVELVVHSAQTLIKNGQSSPNNHRAHACQAAIDLLIEGGDPAKAAEVVSGIMAQNGGRLR